MTEQASFEFALETVAEIKPDIEPLLVEHWEEIAVNKDHIKLNPDWEAYLNLEKLGQLGILSARLNGELIGYFVLIASKHPHYKDHLFAVNDVIYLKPEYRKTGLGSKLIKFAEEELRKSGASVLVINTKIHVPFDSVLVSLGFSHVENTYSKYIGD